MIRARCAAHRLAVKYGQIIRFGGRYLTKRHEIIHYSTVDSTNRVLKGLAAAAQDGTVVLADAQTAGRGRLGRSWNSARGEGAYLSVLVKDTRITGGSVSALVFVCALAFVYSLGIMTDLYDSLYGTFRRGKTSVSGAEIYNDMQGFNKTLLHGSIGMILLCVVLFITSTHSRRRYYIGN